MGFVRSVMWQPVDQPGLELCGLFVEDGWQFDGTVLTAFDGALARVQYGVFCGERWHTESAHATIEVHGEQRNVRLARRKKHWLVNRLVREDLAECKDVDLGITPATNTLPIRRLKLEIGESREVTAAWVRFPSLDVQPLKQTYTRLSEFEYRYQSPNFEARVLVDDLGLVIEYEKGWARVSSSSEA